VGLGAPLGSGIQSIRLQNKNAGDQRLVLYTDSLSQIEATTYHTFYSKEKTPLQARLKFAPEKSIMADKITVQDDTHVTIEFKLPKGVYPSPDNDFPVLQIYSESAGVADLSEALTVVSDKEGEPVWAKELMWKHQGTIQFPFLPILEETIRNLYYHVPMWFGMMIILFVSFIYAIQTLRRPSDEQAFDKSYNPHIEADIRSAAFATVGVLFGVLGIVTGAFWAKHTWGYYWSWDVKQNTSAIALLIYLAYFVLRSSIDDIDKRSRLSAIYNIFSFAMLIPLLYIIPRQYDSLHPGAEGNPAFKSYDLDSTMRLVFYPSIIAFTLLGVWIASLIIRYERIKWKRMI
jgi:heme exporter protein C